MSTPVKGPWFEVPAGTRGALCGARTCQAPIYWIVTEKGKRMPVDVDVDGGFAPSETEGGRGVSHFATCGAVDEFRRPK